MFAWNSTTLFGPTLHIVQKQEDKKRNQRLPDHSLHPNYTNNTINKIYIAKQKYIKQSAVPTTLPIILILH